VGSLAARWQPPWLAAFSGSAARDPWFNARVQQRFDLDFSPSFAPLRLKVTEKTHEDELLGTQTRGPEYADPRVLEVTERARLAARISGAASMATSFCRCSGP